MHAETLINGDGRVAYTSEAVEVYVITGRYGCITEIIYRTFWAYISPNRRVRRIIRGAAYRDHQVNPTDGSLAVWYWKGIDGGSKE